jgi:ATP-dependent Lon protease
MTEFTKRRHVALADTEGSVEAEALSRSVVSDFESYVKLNKKISPKSSASPADRRLLQARRHGRLASRRQDHRKPGHAGNAVRQGAWRRRSADGSEISVLQVEKRIRSRVKRQMEKTQREYYLNEQMKAIQKELGDGEEGRDELAELEERIAKTKLSKEAREKAEPS